MTTAVDVVDNPAEAARLARVPLIVLEPLRQLLDALDIGEGPVKAEPLGTGHSNVTFLIRRGATSVVLRRPPRPPYPMSAHDVLREAQIMAAVREAGIPAPRIVATVDDEAILGVPFVLIEYVPGHDISSAPPPDLCAGADASDVGEQLIGVLADIHAVPVTSGPLARIGRPSGYLERQLRRFAAIWAEVKTREIPELDTLTKRLVSTVPDGGQTTLVHGDFRLGNVLFAGVRPASLAAVLDWEMATLGDPLADLGYLCATWAQPDEPEHPMTALSAVTRAPGFATRAQLAAMYETHTGRSLERLAWYEALALWKSAVFLESSYRRYLAGTTDDPYFETLRAGVPQLIAAAATRLEA